jgi:hypothetical protein
VITVDGLQAGRTVPGGDRQGHRAEETTEVVMRSERHGVRVQSRRAMMLVAAVVLAIAG